LKNDALPIEGIDYVELYVGNAKQASYFYKNGFGFTPVAYSGPETGVKDKTSYLMQQGDIRLLLTSSLWLTAREPQDRLGNVPVGSANVERGTGS
jgi:4-hydroxyphenylpyruvate dioxygenase